MNDCRFGVSPVNYPDPDPDRVRNSEMNMLHRNLACPEIWMSRHAVMALVVQ